MEGEVATFLDGREGGNPKGPEPVLNNCRISSFQIQTRAVWRLQCHPSKIPAEELLQGMDAIGCIAAFDLEQKTS